ncbi:Rmf/CrpP family protein [Burkholderia stagnalis]|uniref:ribosome modulation factor n=1 Tax=Burkholderia stagnalis TaxID=1503054 RepID=UPI0012D8C785|nr:Rmf/CrpP family protein [Burkholderia stagnalis]
MLKRDDIERLMRAGAEAFARGQDIGSCPHPLMSDAAATWRRGFQNAAYGARFVTEQTATRSIS